MAFTETTHSTPFYAQMYDPAQPERGFGAFVNQVTVKEFDDGTRIVGQEVQKDMVAAVREGITLPAVLAEFNMISAARTAELEAQVAAEDAEKGDLRAQVQALTAKNREISGLLMETATALKNATNGAQVAAVELNMTDAETDAAVAAIKADNDKSWWNPLSWFR